MEMEIEWPLRSYYNVNGQLEDIYSCYVAELANYVDFREQYNFKFFYRNIISTLDISL